MDSNTRRILGLLEEGKITADEAERLLKALERPAPAEEPAAEVDSPREEAAKAASAYTITRLAKAQAMRAYRKAMKDNPEVRRIALKAKGRLKRRDGDDDGSWYFIRRS